MRDQIRIGSAPDLEPARGDPVECEIFKRQLIRHFGQPPGSVSLTVENSEVGTGVMIEFETGSSVEVEWVFNLEATSPEYWDDESKRELAAEGP